MVGIKRDVTGDARHSRFMARAGVASVIIAGVRSLRRQHGWIRSRAERLNDSS